MCLAVPATIVELNGDVAVVEVNGVRRSAVVAYLEAPTVGDTVLVHAGFAIRKWSESDLQEYQTIMAELMAPAPATADP